MSIKSLRTGVAAAMGGAVLLAGLIVGASIAFADDSTATTEDRRGPASGFISELEDELGVSLREIGERLRDGEALEDVVADLDIDLESALDSARDRAIEFIDEQVAEGRLSEEQADRIKEHLEGIDLADFDLGEFKFDGHRGFGHFDGFRPFGLLPDLDIDREELHELLESGMSIEEALEDLGVDLDAALDELKQNALSHVDELLEDGVISEERADQMREMIETFDGLPESGFRFRMPRNPFGSLEGFELPDGFDLPEGFELPERLEGLRERLESGMDLGEALEDLGITDGFSFGNGDGHFRFDFKGFGDFEFERGEDGFGFFFRHGESQDDSTAQGTSA